MTPDVYTIFQLVNASSQNLVTVTLAVPGIETSYHQYQMGEWFGYPNAPSPLCQSGGTAMYPGQFLRGQGDEDDAADLLAASGNADAQTTLFALQARTDGNSGHYMQIAPFPGPAIQHHLLGVVMTGTFDTQGVNGVQWYALNSSAPNPIGLGYCSNSYQAIVIVGLDDLYDAADASAVYDAAQNNTLSQVTKQDLYNRVANRCFPGQ